MCRDGQDAPGLPAARRRAPWWGRLLLSVAATFVGLLVVEGGLRLFGYRPRIPRRFKVGRKVIHWPAPGVRFVLEPHSSFSANWPSNPTGYFDESNGVRYQLNNYGFRGKDFSEARTEAVRIALLGDSFCWGHGVKQPDHFAVLLEETLNQDRALGAPVEVYNFGLIAYNTDHEVALLEYMVLRFSPDACVMLFFLNDVGEPGDVIGTMQHLGGDDHLMGLRKYWYVLDLVVTPIDAYVSKRILIKGYQKAYRPDSPGLARIAEAFQRFADICNASRITPVVVIHPVLTDLDESHPFREAHQRVLAAAADAGIVAFDLLDDFEGQDGRALWVHPSDSHPNHLAHRVTAAALRTYLVQLHQQGKLLPAAAAN